MLTVQQVRILLFERRVEIHEGGDRRRTVKGGILRKTRKAWSEVSFCFSFRQQAQGRNLLTATAAHEILRL